MDGVFMKKFAKSLALCALIPAMLWSMALFSDRNALNQELIRFHVVANSDSDQDQSIKLAVRDAVLESIRGDLENLADVSEARTYLHSNLEKIQAIANQTLARLGVDDRAVVSLCREVFDTRDYETFSLPSGVYKALRITIGAGEGRNWWCVTFPGLCVPATASGFVDTAVGAGFSQPLTDALTGEYEVRFFLLDALGRAEAFFFPG